MAELKTLSTIDTSPFKRLVLNLGTTPTAFTEGMTYYELLAWLVKFLEDEVVPKTNESIEGLKELQTYVSTYFDNLDVQEEINNKLDQMAEDGTLARIINEELFSELNNKYQLSIISFPTISEMVSNENIVEGQTVYVKGEATEGDGFSGYYNITSTGQVNGLYTIALNNGLYANLQNQLEDNFYPEITVEKNRELDTDYFLVNIPLKDSSDNNIEMTVVATSDSPNVHAIKNNTNVTVNGPITFSNYGSTVIGNGVVLNDEPLDIPDSTLKIMGIKSDRSIQLYNINTAAQTMIDDDVKNAFIIFGQCMTNGVIDNNFTSHLNKDTDVYLGQKANKDIIILVCNGRDAGNRGFTYVEASTILLNKGCTDVYVPDGGGSSSVSYRGVKLNNNIDNNGISDRLIPYVLDVKKTITNKQTADIASSQGSLKNLISNAMQYKLNGKEPRIFRSVYLIGNQDITPNNNASTTVKNYGISAPVSNNISIDNDGNISLNLPTSNNAPYAIKITGFINVKNSTGGSTSIYSYIYEDNTYQYNRYTRQTITNTDYGCIPIAYILNAGSTQHTYQLKINAPNASSGTIQIENGIVTIEVIPNDKMYNQ